GVAFAAASVWMFVHWVSEMTLTGSDREFLTPGGMIRYFRYQGEDSEVGKYNGGQKLLFWAAALGMLGLLLSGLVMWFPEGLSQRAERAELLAPQAASAEAALRFAAGLYRAQRDLARVLSKAKLSADLDEEAGTLLENAEPLLRYAASGPARLAEEARSRLSDDVQTARTRLLVYWSGGPEARADYLSRALLKPWVELLAAERRPPVR